MKNFFLLLTILAFAVSAVNAEEIRTKIPLEPPKGIPSGRPLSPAKEIVQCFLTDNGNIIIKSQYDAMIYAEVIESDQMMVVASYSSATPSATHTFYVEPQNTTLTIEIQVGDKTYIGEFFY